MMTIYYLDFTAKVICYDGIVILEKKNVKQLKIDAELSFIVYLKEIPEQHGEMLVTTIEDMTTSLRKVYWESLKASEIDEMYKRVILTHYKYDLWWPFRN